MRMRGGRRSAFWPALASAYFPALTTPVSARFAVDVRTADNGLELLTPSERRILNMVKSGQSTNAIAAELHVHPRTVETHRSNICQKLDLSGANSLLRFAIEHRSELLES